MTNKIILRPGVHIGEPAAEYDTEFLKECFVDLPIVEQIRDMNSSKCILLGRTGSGKTAILKHIEETSGQSIRIEPATISFDYIGNSNIIAFLISVGCDVRLLFQLLWKHILCTKAIKCYFESRSVFEKALDRISSADRTARTYFEKYGDRFWVEHDEALREISTGFEQKLASELRGSLGDDFAKVEAGLAAHLKVSAAQRKEIVARTKRAVSELQIRELAHAIEALNELMENRQKNYYIIIDDLDLDWADNEIKHGLIRALIESVRSFRKIRNVKVLVALRSDLYERAISLSDAEGIQPEKFEGITVVIKWNQRELRSLVEKRINHLFRYKYIKQGIKLYDVFPQTVRKQDTFEYLVERTLMRPRDIIAFVNIILDRAAGSANVSPRNITDAEAEYSKKRYQALCHEWMTLHPCLDIYLKFLRERTGKNEVKYIAVRELIVDICLEVDDALPEGAHRDIVVRQCDVYSKRENEYRMRDVAFALLSVLYKVGAIHLKLSKGDVYKASYRDEPFILPEQITLDAAFTVSPVLWRTLGITPNLG